MNTDNERLRDMLIAHRREVERRRYMALGCCAVLGVFAMALLVAVCALVLVKQDEARETRSLEEARAVTSYLAGGRT